MTIMANTAEIAKRDVLKPSSRPMIVAREITVAECPDGIPE